MALDVNYCNRQADKLGECGTSLKNIKKKLIANKKLLNQTWTDKSVNRIIKKFDNVIDDINDAIEDCSKIKRNIKNAAYEVRQKEIEEEQRQMN